jgi:hypothetical protein
MMHDMRHTTLTIESETLEWAQAQADARGISLSLFLSELLADRRRRQMLQPHGRWAAVGALYGEWQSELDDADSTPANEESWHAAV